MDLVFEAFSEMRLTENHIRQLHQHLLRHRDKDERHRGSSKTLPNNVVAFDAGTRESGVVFGTATPFETPREMEALVARSYDTAPLEGGYAYVPYASLERVIEENKDLYYEAVRLQRERTAQGSDDELSDVSRQVLKALREQERLTNAQLASITGANRNTLKVRLRELLAEGRIRRHRKARATWCSL